MSDVSEHDDSNYAEAVSLISAIGALSKMVDPRMSYIAAAQAIARSNLAVVDELRRLNEGRDQFHRTVADFLVTLTLKTRDGSPVGSEQPAAAPVRPECGGCNHGDCPDCEA